MVDQTFIGRLRSVLGADHVMTALEDRICYSFDATFRDANPEVVVEPGSAQEVAEVLRLAAKQGVPVTPRGAATGLSGGAVPLRGGVCLSLGRLNRILSIDVIQRRAVVEPAVITEVFSNAVAKAGLFYPPDPASAKMSTIGGNVAECAGGPRALKYGVTRDYVLGLEVVLPDGRIVAVGDDVDGESCGPDWTMLLVGSEGTLGVVTKIVLRLVEKPAAQRTALAVFNRLEDAAAAVSSIIASGIIPTTLELMDNATIRAVDEYLQAGLPVEAEAVLLVEVDGVKAAVEAQYASLRTILQHCGAAEVQVAATPEEVDRLWSARRSISPACGKLNPTKISEDATVPRSQIPALVRKVKEISQRHRLKMVVFGHAGDGNLHPNILTNKNDAAEMERAEQAIQELFRAAIELGGTLSGEHGIGYMKAPFLAWELGQVGCEIGRIIKRTFDPADLLNPGKLFTANAN